MKTLNAIIIVLMALLCRAWATSPTITPSTDQFALFNDPTPVTLTASGLPPEPTTPAGCTWTAVGSPTYTWAYGSLDGSPSTSTLTIKTDKAGSAAVKVTISQVWKSNKGNTQTTTADSQVVNVDIQNPTTLKYVSKAAVIGVNIGGTYTLEVDDQDGKPIKNAKNIVLLETFGATTIRFLAGKKPIAHVDVTGATGIANSTTGTDGSGDISDTPVTIGDAAGLNSLIQGIDEGPPAVVITSVDRLTISKDYTIQIPSGPTKATLHMNQSLTGTVTGTPPTITAVDVEPAP